jgi:hypothetical protein
MGTFEFEHFQITHVPIIRELAMMANGWRTDNTFKLSSWQLEH